MKKLIFSFLSCLLLASCGGDNTITNPPPPSGGGGNATTAASIVLVSDESAIPSDGTGVATISAYVRDANSNALADTVVSFSAASGGLVVTQARTDSTGKATATLDSGGDPTNRKITVTATAGSVTESVDVAVSGTSLTLDGSTTLSAGQTTTFTATLTDSAGNGLFNRQATITSPGNFVTVSATSAVTDSQGKITFQVTGAATGSGDLSVSALGMTSAVTISVNGNALTFSAPMAGSSLAISTEHTVTAHFAQNGSGSSGKTLTFSATRGSFVVDSVAATACLAPGSTISGTRTTAASCSAATNGSGDVSVLVTSASAGGAVVTALESVTGSNGSVSFEFVATTPASIDAQASVYTIATTQQSTITATVRDANNNLVKGATVAFTLVDTTGGTLSVGTAVTNSLGQAETVYTASTVTSADKGVKITASIPAVPAVGSDLVELTVGGKQLFIAMGTGNKLRVNSTNTQYMKDYIIQVTDATGAPVSGVALSVKVLSKRYFKGYRVDDGENWVTCYTVGGGSCADTTNLPPASNATSCQDEDTLVVATANNGILDSGEDFNNSGLLEAGNIAAVSPGNPITDANGFANITLFYPEEYAYYLTVTLNVSTSVQGTESSRSTVYMLEALVDDLKNDAAPPGPLSPFGQATTCANPN